MTDEEEKLVDRIRLENGLILEVFDRSRHVAGDRWLVSLVARIELEIRLEYFEDQHAPEVAFEDIRAVLGGKAAYRYEKTRNFIAETEKDDVFGGLKKRFLEATQGYLSGPDFPRKLILMEYKKARSLLTSWKSQ